MANYVILKENIIIRPTYTKQKPKLHYVPMEIGECVTVEKGTVICAQSIGNNVHIGKNCIIGHRCVIKDNCKILDGAILAPDTVVPPFTVFGG
jgi:dynactin 5